ncbi:MAG: 50S ribosomal protein L9 [Acidobacteria bacterium]|nr:50S ribosomal protein L9 [Acidobacteriota bacterium]
MRMILRGDVEGLGRRGDVVDVTAGYARNFLVPKGLGLKATDNAEVAAASTRKVRAEKHASDRSDAEEIASRLVPTVINLSARSGAGDRLFGSVSSADVVQAIEEQTGIVIDRKQIVISEAIKDIGQHIVTAKLHSEVEFPVTIEVAGQE